PPHKNGRYFQSGFAKRYGRQKTTDAETQIIQTAAVVMQMRTYVEYSLPSKTVPAGACIVERVSDRDVSKLDFPKDATGFYFFDSKILAEDPYDAQNDQRNCSEHYIIAE